MTKKDKPDWVKKLENMGEEIEQKCDKCENGKSRNCKDKKSDYVGTIIINIIFIYLWRWLPSKLPFLADSFAAILPLFYISFVASIAANILFIIHDGRFFKGIIKTALNLFGLAILFSLYYIFPFNFSAYSVNWDLILRILLIIGIVGTIIAIISELIKAIFGDNCNK